MPNSSSLAIPFAGRSEAESPAPDPVSGPRPAAPFTGPGIWGEPADRPEALRTLKRLPELEVNFVDTADAYGPDVSEELIRIAVADIGRSRR